VLECLLEGNSGRTVKIEFSLVNVLAVVPNETVRTFRFGMASIGVVYGGSGVLAI
jgi:hypothetical protein